MASKVGFRTWILLVLLILSLWLIRPTFDTGVIVKGVHNNDSLYTEGLRSGQIIKQVNGINIETVSDYSDAIESQFLDGLEKKLEIKTDVGSYIVLTDTIPDISVGDVPKSRIQTGLDLRGGARALVQADQPLTEQELDDLIAVSSNRFNVFGISDVQVRGVSDLAGNRYMLVEVAGATPQDLETLIGQQGKFEGKIGNTTVFDGDKGDISDVCRNDATCSAVTGCFPSGGGYVCTFQFTIFLTNEAAERHASVTDAIPLEASGQYLTQNLDLMIDGNEVNSLRIGSSLKGEVTTQISIQGSGSGLTQNEAIIDARENMKSLQTILITGSLPYELEIVKLDTISPSLGEEFTQIILFAGLASILVVAIIIFARYRNFKASLALLFTSFSELVLILGFAAMIKWNLDLPSIAGILATIGTGVDSQIIILDEARKKTTTDVKNRIKRALFIILAVYFTSLASLVPLYWAGAGLFKGFAVTTIIGITAGVFVSRPAFAEMVGKIVTKEEER